MFKRISVHDALALHALEDTQWVDIRDEQSYQAGHIPRALLLGSHNLPAFIAAADLDKPLLVCCYHGNSSQSAAAFLVEKGFENVYSIDGGFEAWKTQGPVAV